jgi:hypothetical protein
MEDSMYKFFVRKRNIKKYLLLVFIIFLSCNKLDPKVETAVNAIRKVTYVIPDWLIRDDEYKNLMNVATNEDLVFLTNDEDAKVRYYAFIGLMERNYPKINEIYQSHKNEEDDVFTSNGACLRNTLPLNFLLTEAIEPGSFYNLVFSENKYHKK